MHPSKSEKASITLYSFLKIQTWSRCNFSSVPLAQPVLFNKGCTLNFLCNMYMVSVMIQDRRGNKAKKLMIALKSPTP